MHMEKYYGKFARPMNYTYWNHLKVGERHFNGDFTFYKGGRQSQNDIYFSNVNGLYKVESFSVNKIGWNFSNRFPISITIALDLYDACILFAASKDTTSSGKIS